MAKPLPPRLTRVLIEAMAKHLPPSSSELRLVDLDGSAGEILAQLRPDLQLHAVSTDADTWPSVQADANTDSVVAFGALPSADTLQFALEIMRPGGRLIVVDPHGEPDEATVKALEAVGFTRILVETAAECPLPTGVLMRGEKPHITPDTLERVQQVAQQDADRLDLSAYRGRYVHLLIKEEPNQPAWTRQPQDPIAWSAVALQAPDQAAQTLLAFSSLPKAVAFMQPAVLSGRVKEINKVAKFSLAMAQKWSLPVLLNPTVDALDRATLTWVQIDPTEAEAPDE